MKTSMHSSMLLLTLAVGGLSALAASDAQARERSRTRTVGHVDGARSAAVNAHGSGAHGSYARARQWQAGGQGNASGSRGATVSGANGGSATRQASAYRNADGSAARQGSASVSGANGGTASTSGSISRSADGSVTGGRQTSVTGANGNSYQGSTTVGNGSISHTGTCTNGAGEVVACRP